MTQLDVVLALEISYTHYARIEQGVRGMSLKMLYALMKFFDVDANTILGIEEVDSYGR
jgi:transcriptional regulator with XRE-family HTH domain